MNRESIRIYILTISGVLILTCLDRVSSVAAVYTPRKRVRRRERKRNEEKINFRCSRSYRNYLLKRAIDYKNHFPHLDLVAICAFLKSYSSRIELI